MRRFAYIVALLCLIFFPEGAKGQEADVRRNIGLDSLMAIMQGCSSEKVYYQSDAFAKNLTFTVNVQSSTLMEDIKGDLMEKGYKVFPFRGYLFVLKGVGLAQSLPDSWFAVDRKVNMPQASKDYIDALSGRLDVATSSNKTYQIGDKDNVSRSGKGYLSGFVRDAVTGEPVAGVALVEASTQIYAVSDAHGFYKILLPVGKNELDVSGFSLEDSKVHLQVYNDGSLDVVVKERVFALSGVVVSADNANKVRTNTMGVEKVRMDKIKNVPMVFGEADVVKIILTLPGVKSVGEASSGFNVRGGATDQNLVLFNGGTVYNPSHLFGMFSGFNPDVVSGIELYKSSVPVEFGGRISSVLDVNSREGNNKDLTGSLGVGLLTAKGHIEGPVGKKTTFIAGVRATYSDWLLSMLPSDSEYNNGSASFYDITAGLTHKFNKDHSLHVNGYFSHDGFSFSEDTTYMYRNANGSIKWKWNMGDRNSLELSAGYDQYNYATCDKFNPVNAYEMTFRIRQGVGKLKFRSLLSERHTLTYGADGIMYNLEPGSYLPYGDASLVTPDIIPVEDALEGSAYLSDSWNISDKVFLDYGVRYSMFKSDKVYGGPEARISARVMLTDKLSFKAGFNTMRQYIHMLSNSVSISPTDIWKLSDKDIRPQDGWQAAGGLYATLFNNTVEASVEGYYKSMENYLDYKSGAVIVMNRNIAQDVISTRGQAYGVEVMLKKPVGKLNGWLSYTYSKTQLKEVEGNGSNAINGGEWYDASYDKPHDAKLVANYKFTHRVSLSLNGDYSTGRPITVPVARYEYGGGYRLYYSNRNSYRLPDYMRLDAALNIEPTHKIRAFTHFSFSIGVYNLTGRKNVYSVYFEADENGHIQGRKLCIFGAPIPYVNFNFKF